ncbi:MAG: phosphoribosyltransferase [Pseudomonadota bacterium]
MSTNTQPHVNQARDDDAVQTVQKYRETDDKLFMSLDEAVILCEALADEVRSSGFAADAVVGIANGALLPTRVIADRLGMPCEYVRYRRQGSTIKRRLGKVPGLRELVVWLYSFKAVANRLAPIMDSFNRLDSDSAKDNDSTSGFPGDGRVLLVDDAIDSGQSIAIACEQLRARGAQEIRTAVITWSDAHDSMTNFGIKPEYYLNRRVQHYPWSENNKEIQAYRAWLSAHDLYEWQ